MFNGTFQQKSWQPIFKVIFFVEDQSFYSSIGAMENRQAPDAFALGPPSRVSSHLADRRASGAKKKWMEDGMSRNEEGDLWNMGEYTRVSLPQLDEKGESAKCLKSDNTLEYLQGSNQEFQCDESGLICKWCKWLFLYVYNILWSSPKPLRHCMRFYLQNSLPPDPWLQNWYNLYAFELRWNKSIKIGTHDMFFTQHDLKKNMSANESIERYETQKPWEYNADGNQARLGGRFLQCVVAFFVEEKPSFVEEDLLILGYKFAVQDIRNLESNGTYEYDFIGPRLSSAEISTVVASRFLKPKHTVTHRRWIKGFLLTPKSKPWTWVGVGVGPHIWLHNAAYSYIVYTTCHNMYIYIYIVYTHCAYAMVGASGHVSSRTSSRLVDLSSTNLDLQGTWWLDKS